MGGPPARSHAFSTIKSVRRTQCEGALNIALLQDGRSDACRAAHEQIRRRVGLPEPHTYHFNFPEAVCTLTSADGAAVAAACPFFPRLVLPSLPRSWCNWLSPNISAFSTTQTPARGTSTPTFTAHRRGKSSQKMAAARSSSRGVAKTHGGGGRHLQVALLVSGARNRPCTRRHTLHCGNNICPSQPWEATNTTNFLHPERSTCRFVTTTVCRREVPHPSHAAPHYLDDAGGDKHPQPLAFLRLRKLRQPLVLLRG